MQEPLTVMLVSDNRMIADAYAPQLEMEGYVVIQPADEIEAFRRLRAEPPDLLLVDRSAGPESAGVLLGLLDRCRPLAFPIISIERCERPEVAPGVLPLTMVLVYPGDGEAKARPPAAYAAASA